MHGDGRVPRMFTDGTRYFTAMQYNSETFTRLIEWLGGVGFEAKVVDSGELIVKDAFAEGSDMHVPVTSWVSMFPHLTFFTDKEFRELARPAVMCGYDGQ